ncbi:protein FD-like [Primulina eburnea]|uniref:protein FD-like n=1 Tax=Primulina eburnea TaxID=1245227 RepID=UPI003C6BFC5D
MWTSPSSSNSIPFSSSSSYAILGNDTNSSNSRLPKPMEEIWNDITLSSLHPGNNSSRGMILQDFFGKDPPHSAVDASPPPPPPTVLSLSSRQEHYFNCAPPGLHPQDHRSHVSPLVLPFEGRVTDESPGCGNKKFPDLGGSSVDRHHKRMIKNRESAARSRARKQENIVLHHLFTPNISISCVFRDTVSSFLFEFFLVHFLDLTCGVYKKRMKLNDFICITRTSTFRRKEV